MENVNTEQPLAVIENLDKGRKCAKCGEVLPTSMFKKRGGRYSRTCIHCERQVKGISDKFKDFTSRELIEELRSRGYKGMLKYVRVEEFKV